MANEALLNLGTELILETAAASAQLDDETYRECDSDDRQPGDDTGYPLGLFEFSLAAAGLSAAATAGNTLILYEQKINSDGNDAPDVSATFKGDFLHSWELEVDDGNTAQHLSALCPIHRYGGKYWLYWEDGGAGTADITLAWELRLTPVTYGT